MNSVNSEGTGGGIIEYVATFPNTTAKMEMNTTYVLKESYLICHTGNNSPALRPEIVELYLQEGKPKSTQATKILGEEQ